MLATAAVLLTTVAGRSALAQTPVPLAWSGPEGCPTQAEVRAEVSRLTAGSTEPARLVDVAAHVARDARGYRVRVETTLRDGRAARDLAAPTCRELADATATIVALMIDPAVAERGAAPACVGCVPAGAAPPAAGTAAVSAPAPPSTAGTPATPPATGAPSPAGAAPPAAAPATAVARPLPASTTSRGRAARRNAPRAAPGASGAALLSPTAPGRDQASPATVPSQGRDPRWSLGARLAGDVGIMPEPALGALIAGGVALGRVRLELAGGWFPGREVTLERATAAGGELSLIVVGATGCYRFRQAAPALDLCSGMELDHMRGSGLGVTERRDGGAWWASALGTGRVSMPVVEWMTLDAEMGAALGLGPPKFVLEGRGILHQPSLVSGRGGAGASFHFR
jgi:hypothetical protein